MEECLLKPAMPSCPIFLLLVRRDNGTEATRLNSDYLNYIGFITGASQIEDSSVKVYPNPTRGNINFSEEVSNVSVYNLNGIQMTQGNDVSLDGFEAVSIIEVSPYAFGRRDTTT